MSKKEAEVEAPEQEELPEEGPVMRKKAVGITAEAKIEILVEDNPKRAGSKARDVFEIYLQTKPKTVQEAMDNGIGKDHVAYDFIHGFITVEGAEVVEYEVKPRGPAKTEPAEEVVADDGADAPDSEDIF